MSEIVVPEKSKELFKKVIEEQLRMGSKKTRVSISKELLKSILYWENENLETNDIIYLNVENGVVKSAEIEYEDFYDGNQIKLIEE
jgi:hypothetical protein